MRNPSGCVISLICCAILWALVFSHLMGWL
jgi:hypothetical protein